ncbi:MAG: Uma2 family endonuclease [Pseudomonadota bacterium]|nr:Uma2 family endonuclease [Pseudomonadota bacterium]
MQWSDVLNDSSLRNLPYKIELNEWGQIVMSPASNRHGLIQSRIAWSLRNQLPQGETISECSVQTARGVKVADVAWASAGFIARHGLETPYQAAPEICIEIVSPSNSPLEMEEKRRLYFASGAQEVWIVAEDGGIGLYDAGGRIPRSRFGASLEGVL